MRENDDVLASFIKVCLGKKKVSISCRLKGILYSSLVCMSSYYYLKRFIGRGVIVII